MMNVKNAFLKSLDKKEFEHTIEIVARNSYGKIYLIGSRIYKGAASELYGTAKPTGDWDFIIEELSDHVILPEGWEMTQTGLGGSRLMNKNNQIDIAPMKKLIYITRNNLQPTIENFLTGTPLNIQSIVYDIFDETLQGDIGMRAILEKTARINHKEESEFASKRKGLSVYEYTKSKITGMDFKIEL